ncbi:MULTISPECIES: hypothetical protein [Vibrio]|uniref:Uncharacterized protein n=1 Tax=Vibrio tasmaniensis TaxID=212663 RepID=A0A2N7NCM7_9VIBR|nr:hypothetical protein [Vibrio tasmaniensis]PMO89872.1 hypothetical protein BCT01_00905 [Vibrio tasmaniensis]PMP09956.1 hypothetical protein BCS92_02185 [Vibrio tasmaniensis]TKG27977.1 hypothetical protein FC057_22580 [Vibrio tasmaniensis]TKG40538.1 hypothetical protein FC060_23805 [Vibrio tasmaniensis]TKG41658.1 hypothetical protein FC063_07290 [Vibrio tasmaniensis]
MSNLNRKFIALIILGTTFSFAGGLQAATCKSSSQLLQEKMSRYGMPEFPSLLEDCGLNELINGFGGEIFKSIKLPDFGNFCGYSAKDIGNWYGVDMPDSIGTGVGYKFNDVKPSSLVNGSELFESGSGLGLRMDVE